MLVFCKSISIKSVSPERRFRGENDSTEFSPLVTGSRYVVYGIMISRRIDFLVCSTEQGPLWAPSELFDIEESTLPSWKICLTLGAEGYSQLHDDFQISALLGYDELVEDYRHYLGILERDSEELVKFFHRKNFYDQWQLSVGR